MKILVLNPGSNSLKFELIEAEPSEDSGFGSILITGAYDDIGKEHSSFSIGPNRSTRKERKLRAQDHGHATELLFEWIEQNRGPDNPIRDLSDLGAIGCRVVHGADRFDGPAELTDDVIGEVEALEDLAPLHNKSALKVIRTARERVKDRIPMIGVFDTAFHRTIPERAALYGLPLELARKHKIRRYGFHGISHRYMMLRYAQLVGKQASELTLITLHLEGGSSVAAIRRGNSADTSMGFTPLEGLMMSTRSGDLDPAIVTYLMRKENWTNNDVEQFLNRKCGLLGVSDVAGDTRVLRDRLSESAVNLAIDSFCYRVCKYIGAYLAALGGADAIVAGGGISENTPFVRERIFEDFDWCGAILDRDRNANTVDLEAPITTPESRLPVWVVPAQEGLMIAKETADYLNKNS